MNIKDMDMKERKDGIGKLGSALGYMAGFITGAIAANCIIFPALTGYTLAGFLRLLLTLPR